jgi:hypothetical protein
VADIEILPVIEHYIELQPKGSEHVACCPHPEHQENTPSFTVNSIEGYYKCFGCGWGGDAIAFVRVMEPELTFKQAIDRCSEILGYDVGEIMSEREGGEKEDKNPVKAPATPMAKEEIREFMQGKGYVSNGYRGIKDEYNKFFGHLTELDENGNVKARYYPETQKGKLTGYKCRNHPKDFTYGKVGVTGAASELSGQVKFKSGDKYLLIVGGEEDKVAAFQMLRDAQKSRNQQDFNPIAVVSPTSGEGSVAKQAAAQYDWCNQFENILIGMDNDEAGIKAAEDLAAVLPKEKVKIVTWSGKDPNQMLIDGKSRQFIRDFYNAKEYAPSGIKTSKDADDEIEQELERLKVPLPPFMEKLQYIMAGGIAMGYIVNLAAQTGGGKTTIINEMIYYWIFNSPHKIGILSLELNAGQYQISMLSRHIGRKIQLIENPKEAVDFVNQDWVREKRAELRENEFGEERFALLDERDGGLESVKLQIEKLIKKHGCRLIIIDPVNDLFEGCSLDEQTSFIKYMKQVVKEGVSIFNVCHITKGKTEVDKKTGQRIMRKLTEDDFSGVSNLAKSGGCNIFATRDKYAEDPMDQNTTFVEVPKCRWTGRAGAAGEWYYDNQTHTLHDKDAYLHGGAAHTTTVVVQSNKEESPPESEEPIDF